MPTYVFNGWAAEPDVWSRCTFHRDRVFDYLEQLDGVPERLLAAQDGFVLVGFSLGGTTALRLLLRFPERVRGLVLVSATARMMEERRDGAVVWAGMSERRRAALKYGTQLMNQGNPSPLFREDNLDRGLDVLQTTDLRADLLALSPNVQHIPVAILQSERDGIVRPTNADFLKGVFPQARVTLVPGGEHTLPASRPELVDAAVSLVFSKH